ncbi:hypothetical protein F947_01496 [Acinetobacter towneri DSM 14962 = CIP 107472]|nr:hypothetical protein F947_01496 [Acinetobacter towneri DSM 14962 = CIP 107472]
MAKRKIIVTSSFKRDIKRRYLELHQLDSHSEIFG